MNPSSRALIILASYDFESLQLTLRSLTHTVDKNEKIVVILNGIGCAKNNAGSFMLSAFSFQLYWHAVWVKVANLFL